MIQGSSLRSRAKAHFILRQKFTSTPGSSGRSFCNLHSVEAFICCLFVCVSFCVFVYVLFRSLFVCISVRSRDTYNRCHGVFFFLSFFLSFSLLCPPSYICLPLIRPSRILQSLQYCAFSIFKKVFYWNSPPFSQHNSQGENHHNVNIVS